MNCLKCGADLEYVDGTSDDRTEWYSEDYECPKCKLYHTRTITRKCQSSQVASDELTAEYTCEWCSKISTIEDDSEWNGCPECGDIRPMFVVSHSHNEKGDLIVTEELFDCSEDTLNFFRRSKEITEYDDSKVISISVAHVKHWYVENGVLNYEDCADTFTTVELIANDDFDFKTLSTTLTKIEKLVKMKKVNKSKESS